MISAYKAVTMEAINDLLVLLGMVYLVLVGLGYATEGPHYQLRFDVRHPIITARRLLVGLGVRLAARLLRVAKLLLDPLFEASAEVGDWVADHASPETRSRILSRFI